MFPKSYEGSCISRELIALEAQDLMIKALFDDVSSDEDDQDSEHLGRTH